MKAITVKGILGRLALTLALLVLICPVVGGLVLAGEVQAVTTANVTILITPGAIGITDNVTSIDFGTVVTSGEVYVDESYIGITNASTVETDITIGTTNETMTGTGTPWTIAADGNAGADTVGLLANRGGTWSSGDIVIKYASPNYIYEDCPALTDFDYGIKIKLPTSVSDTNQKGNEVVITASAS